MGGGADTTHTAGDNPGSAPGLAARQYLFLVLESHRPALSPMRLAIDGFDTVTVGRGRERAATAKGTELELRLDDSWVSKSHARLTKALGRWMLEDTGSRNGSSVNGTARQKTLLADGDVIELGHAFFIYRDTLAGARAEPDTGIEPLAIPLMEESVLETRLRCLHVCRMVQPRCRALRARPTVYS